MTINGYGTGYGEGTDHLATLARVHVGLCRDQADWAPVGAEELR
jgi:hypothetical protein